MQTTNPEVPKLISLVDAAQQLGLLPSQLRRMRFNGSGPPAVKIGGHVLYTADDLTSWVQAHKEVGVR